jgi:hypothetical protein
MTPLLDFLHENPLVTAALVIVALGIVLTVLKKLFKIALILILVFLIAGGTVFHLSQRDVVNKGRELLEKVGKTVNDKVKEYADSAKSQILKDTMKTGNDKPKTLIRKKAHQEKDR